MVIMLSTKNRVIGVSCVSIGTLNASIVHPREVFSRCIISNSASLALCHNHPSGDPSASPEDIALTKKLVAAGELLDLKVIDHIIVGDGVYSSFKELGLL